MSQQAPAQREYFNLHTNGVGYLNRIRWVEPKGHGRKAEPFLACAISALRGASDSPDYTYFDLRVSSPEAADLIESLQQAVADRRKVLVTFRIADTYAHAYERDERDSSGRPTGKKEMSALIKGRLILIYSVKVDGEVFYQRPQAEAALNPLEQFSEGHEPSDSSAPAPAAQPSRHREQAPRQSRNAPPAPQRQFSTHQGRDQAQRPGYSSRGGFGQQPARQGHGHAADSREYA